MDEPPELSIVVPAYNELENLEPLLGEIHDVLDSIGREWEIVIVDDGSTDGSAGLLFEKAAGDQRLRPVALAARVGQSGALAAGLARARGAILITLDADLQNDPRDIPDLLASLENADVVSGVRTSRQDSWRRRASSRIANRARRAFLGDTITDIGCSLKAYRREAIEGLPLFAGVHRFLPALCELRGSRVVEIPVRHRPRRHGRSSYGLSNRLGRSIHDLLGVRWLKSRLIRYSVRKEGP